VTVQTLNNWRREGVLNPLKIGDRVLYRKEDVYNNSAMVVSPRIPSIIILILSSEL
jgi:hypothetical protein